VLSLRHPGEDWGKWENETREPKQEEKKLPAADGLVKTGKFGKSI